MNQLDPNIENTLRAILVGRVCLVGVGNRQRGDDGAGPRVMDARRPGTSGVWLDVGSVPENYLEPIAQSKPDTILIVDAVAFGGDPGEVRFVSASQLDTLVVSTHAGSLAVLGDYLSARTSSKLYVIGIQPQRITAGPRLTSAVETSVGELAALLSDLLTHDSGRSDPK